MSIENKRTLDVYKKNAQLYLNQTKNISIKDKEKFDKKLKNIEKLIKNSFSSLPKNAKIFEIGSADGEHAKYIQSLGYNVTASDIADTFINEIKNKGLNAIKFDVLEDNFHEKYLGIFCYRVFVHFTKEDALKVLKKVYNALENNGIFVFNAMNRNERYVENEWVDFEGDFHMGEKRFYNYFDKDELDEMIKQNNFNICNFYTEGGKENSKWLVYTLKK